MSHPAARSHRRDVARWALSLGLELDRDTLATIVALRAEPSGAIDTSWSIEQLALLVIHEIGVWSSSHGVAPPPDPVPTLDTYLRYLAVHRRLGPDSASMAQLRRALDDLPRAVRRAGHPATGGRRAAPVVPIS